MLGEYKDDLLTEASSQPWALELFGTFSEHLDPGPTLYSCTMYTGALDLPYTISVRYTMALDLPYTVSVLYTRALDPPADRRLLTSNPVLPRER